MGEEDDVKTDKAFGGYKVQPKNTVYKKSEIIQQAIDTMTRDINLSEYESKENVDIIEDHFKKLLASLDTKKTQLLSSLNEYYDAQKQETKQRIKELENQMIEEKAK